MTVIIVAIIAGLVGFGLGFILASGFAVALIIQLADESAIEGPSP